MESNEIAVMKGAAHRLQEFLVTKNIKLQHAVALEALTTLRNTLFDYAFEIFVGDEATQTCGHEVIQISADSVDAAKAKILVPHPLAEFGNVYQKIKRTAASQAA
jgi:hypothetical protein